MPVNTTEYFSLMVEKFLNAIRKLREMELHFNPSTMMKEYNQVKSTMVSAAADLIKMGAECYQNGEVVCITVEEEIYDIPREDLKDFMGIESFDAVFGESESYEEVPEEEITEKEKSQNKAGEERNDYLPYLDSPYPYAPLVMPIATFLSQLMMPFMGMAQSYQMQQPAYGHSKSREQVKGSELMKDVNSFQKKIISLEREKDEAVAESEQIKEKCEAMQLKIEEAEKNLEAEKESYSATLEALSQERTELNLLLEAQQQTNNSMVVEKNALEEKISALSSQIQDKERETVDMGIKYSELIEQKKVLDAEFAKLKEEEQKIQSESEAKVSSLQKELNSVKEQLSKTSENLNKAQADVQRVMEEKRGVENAGRDSSRQLDELQKQLANQKKRAEESSKRFEESEKALKNSKTEKDSLKNSLEDVRKEKDRLSNELNELKKGDQEKVAFYKNMEKELAELKRLAYEDEKAGTANLNAFNRDFPNVAKNETILAMVSISGMKMINLSYGRETGDSIILKVADDLIKAFGKKNVYRIMGDQFVILAKNTNYDNVYSKLADIYNTLAVQSISIGFGIAIGNNCGELGQMISVAETGMNQMKAGGVAVSAAQKPQETSSIPQDISNLQSETKEPVVTKAADEPEELEMDEMLMQFMQG